MPDFFRKAWNNAVEFFGELSAGKKLAAISVAVTIILVITGMFVWAGRTTYTVLLTNLSAEDSTATIRYLREKKIPFIVDESGKTISVPPEKVYDLRLELSSNGLAQTGVVGYEVFDKQSFGTTSTVERINEQRALEGELVRTIDHIRGIERSRVHLAVPEKSAFLEDEKKPTASVVLDLNPAFTPSDDQVRGIQHMVASAVKGLDVNSVMIISNSGKQLSQNADDPAAVFAAAALDYQRKFERKMEDKVQSLLNTVVGEGKVVAKVNADFDFSRVAETQTLVDAENSAVLATTKDNDVMNGSRPLPGGAAGAKANIPGADNQAANQNNVATNNTQRVREVTNYEIPKTTRSTEKPMATLKRLSVAVMVDAAPIVDAKAPGGVRYEPLSEAKLAEFRSMVANAVGWEQGRDPQIEVKSISFYKEDMEAAAKAAEEAEHNRLVNNITKWVVVGLTFTLFFMFVVRPFIIWITENTVDSIESFLPQTLDELEKNQSRRVAASLEDIMPEIEEKIDPQKVQSEMLKEKVVSLVNENPHKASQILHEWILEKPADKKNEKTA